MVSGVLPILVLASGTVVSALALPVDFSAPLEGPTTNLIRKFLAHKKDMSSITPASTTRAGFVSLSRDSWGCGAFAWDENPDAYGNNGYAFRAETEEDARAQALAYCQQDVPDNACEVKSSWCGKTKCVALAFSTDWQWYAYNDNPVSATKAAMYAMNNCTQSACDARGWDETCTSGRPVCYVEAVYCGAEAMGAAYTKVDEEAGTSTFTALDESTWVETLEGYEPELFADPEQTLLAQTLPYGVILPQTAVDPTVIDDTPPATDPAYVSEDAMPEDEDATSGQEEPAPEEEDATTEQVEAPEDEDATTGEEEAPENIDNADVSAVSADSGNDTTSTQAGATRRNILA